MNMASAFDRVGDIVHLNVGGTRFSTSKQTLTWVPDSFFSSMLSGRISTLRDESGALFIDRDPVQFATILNYLRTKEIDLRNVDIKALRHEAEFYGVTPLLRRLVLCESLEEQACGDILFHGMLPPPCLPYPLPGLENRRSSDASVEEQLAEEQRQFNLMERHFLLQRKRSRRLQRQHSSSLCSEDYARQSLSTVSTGVSSLPGSGAASGCSSTTSTLRPPDSHSSKETSPDVQVTKKIPALCNPNRVIILKGHFNWIAAAYPHFVCLYRLKDSMGWNRVWTSNYIEEAIDRIALNVKMGSPAQNETCNRMVAVSTGMAIILWRIGDDGQNKEIGRFNLTGYLENLFFIGSHLVALSPVGKVGVWHAMTQNWQIQDVVPIYSYDTAGSFLLLGCENGSIYYIDMQKFPLRMKDNDLLVTELFKDPGGEMVTALSVYLTPKTSLSGNWIEIAYGTHTGKVRVIVQHPETVGQGPQLFQTFTVHTSTVIKVMLSEKTLISVCNEYNHVRSWSVTRFRGMISTQPGSMPLASFKVVSLEHMQPINHYQVGNDIGPYGEKDDLQVFIQKVVPDTDTLFVRLASTGKRVCVIQSVDGSDVTSFCVHECEGSSRMGSRPRRYIFTGHSEGSIQMWDLSTALELANKDDSGFLLGGPSASEFFNQISSCDICQSSSPLSTQSASPSYSLFGSSYQLEPLAWTL